MKVSAKFSSVVCCLVLSALEGPVARADEGRVPAREVVVYSALRPAHWDLYLFEDEGASPRRLTTDPALDYNATFSPDGRWLVFTSERDGNPDLYVLDMDAPGSSPRPLTRTPFLEDAAAFSADGSRLAFVSTRDGNADVHVMPFREGKASVGEAINLTRHPGGDFNPSFSPDGTWLVFSSNRDAAGRSARRESEVYRMKADGSEPVRLTRSKGWDGSPVVSSDGGEIYFYSERQGALSIWRMDADGSNPQSVSKGGRALSPALAREGRILFAERQGSRWRIRSVGRDGSGVRTESDADRDYWAPAHDPARHRWVAQGAPPDERRPFAVAGKSTEIELSGRHVTVRAIRGTFPALDPSGRRVVSDYFGGVAVSDLVGGALEELRHPSGDAWAFTWSADGGEIAFAVGPGFAGPNAAVDVWKLALGGAGPENLTASSSHNDALPDFSPDGRRVVFRSGRDGNDEIYLMASDGSGVRRLTRHPGTDTMPSFSPRGDQVVFASDRDDNFELYALDLEDDGAPGGLRRLTHHPGRDMHPAYSPDGEWVVFASERGGLNDEQALIPVFNPQSYGEIFALYLEDLAVVRLTHNKWEDGTPTWGTLTPAD